MKPKGGCSFRRAVPSLSRLNDCDTIVQALTCKMWERGQMWYIFPSFHLAKGGVIPLWNPPLRQGCPADFGYIHPIELSS